MRIALVSDIHGNRQAFEAVLAEIATESVAELWCLGDLVGYGADPDACVELARDHAHVCLVGNHDLAVRGDIALNDFSRGAALAARWTRDAMDPVNMEFLGGLQPMWIDGSVGLYHASPRDPVWEYVLSSLLANLCLDVQPHRICFVGHSHVALAFSRAADGMATGQTQRGGTLLDMSDDEWLVNPGSVGQPRDGDARAAWLLLDTDAWSAEFKRTEYDVAGAAAAIRAARLPESLAERLEYGQ